MTRLVLYLLDSEAGPPRQYWSFSGETLINVGRSIDNEVVIPSPYVSRGHAYLAHEAGAWSAVAISPLGLIHQGRRVDHLPLLPGMVFRLGPNGPLLRFGTPAFGESEVETVQPEPGAEPGLLLDYGQLEREVAEVAGTAFFEDLRRRARELRDPSPAALTPRETC
jgi:hypothetical protein